jgi:hypothetical protein
LCKAFSSWGFFILSSQKTKSRRVSSRQIGRIDVFDNHLLRISGNIQLRTRDRYETINEWAVNVSGNVFGNIYIMLQRIFTRVNTLFLLIGGAAIRSLQAHGARLLEPGHDWGEDPPVLGNPARPSSP